MTPDAWTRGGRRRAAVAGPAGRPTGVRLIDGRDIGGCTRSRRRPWRGPSTGGATSSPAGGPSCATARRRRTDPGPSGPVARAARRRRRVVGPRRRPRRRRRLVRPGIAALGIDVEPTGPLSAEMAAVILRPDEAGLDAHLAFTLKEAVYKAWSAVGGELIDSTPCG